MGAQEEARARINFFKEDVKEDIKEYVKEDIKEYIKEDIKDEVFTLTVNDPHVKTVVIFPFNFSVSIDNAPWVDDELEVTL